MTQMSRVVRFEIFHQFYVYLPFTKARFSCPLVMTGVLGGFAAVGKTSENKHVADIYKNDVAEQYNIMTIGIFGSTARGEAGKDSDIDVVIHISEPDLFMIAGIKNDLEAKFCRPVDIVTYQDTMKSIFKKKNR